jgi:hypothetical protein
MLLLWLTVDSFIPIILPNLNPICHLLALGVHHIHHIGRIRVKPSIPALVHCKKVKVKVTLVQALRLCTGRTAHKGSRALLFHDHGTRRGWGVSVTPRPLFTPGKEPVPIVQEAGWASGPVWTSAENLGPTGIRSPDRPARSQSLYRLSFCALYRSFIHMLPATTNLQFVVAINPLAPEFYI